MAQTLKKTTIWALAWNLVDKLGQQVLQFAVAVVVANLLFPEDYAVVAMLTIFTAVGNIIVESGFGAALIQKKDADDVDFSTVFWFNLAASVVFYAVMVACLRPIAAFFREPMLCEIGWVVFLSFPLNASMLIQTTILTKNIQFRTLTRVNLCSMVLSSALTLWMALKGWGVWALVWQPVSLAAFKSVMMWWSSSWRPRLAFDISRLRALFGFASSLLLSSLINTCFVNVYSLVIPRLYPKRELGLFTQGNKICDPVVNIVYGSIQNATFPIFSSIQNDAQRLLRAERKCVRFTSFIAFPLLLGGIAIAPEVFRLLFKAEWWDAIPYFQWLCVGSCFTVLTAINNNFIKVSGRSSGILKIEVWKVVFTVIAIAVLMHHSVMVMVAGLAGVRAAIHIVAMAYTHRYTGYRFLHQLRDTLPYTGLACCMLAALWALRFVPVLGGSLWLMLLAKVVLGAAVYVGLCYLTGSHILKEIIGLRKNS